MKILIIPDIHNKHVSAEKIITKEKPRMTIFLGDYFDDFNDTLEETHDTAEWLKKSMTDPHRIHLIGNHDLSYINQKFPCAGFSEGKLWAIKNAGVDLTKLSHYCWVDDWLCTHAGLSRDFFSAYNYKNLDLSEFLDNMIKNNKDRLYDCSWYRGGKDAHPGIVWCDYNEFEDIPNVKQIFGHTHGELRRKIDKENNTEHICLDTWLKYYAVYDTNKHTMECKKVD